MRKNLIFLTLFIPTLAFCQIGIGTTNPDPSAALDIFSNNKGILIPRVADTSAVNNAALGLLIFDNGDKTFYYHNGSKWVSLGGSSSNSLWTDAGGYVKADNTAAVVITDIGNVGIGTLSPAHKLDINGGDIHSDNFRTNSTSSFSNGGYFVGVGNNIGPDTYRSTFVGNKAGSSVNASEVRNSTFIGYEAGKNSDAEYVTTVGFTSGTGNTGNRLTAVGTGAGVNNQALDASAFGAFALNNASGLGYPTGLGYGAGSSNTGDDGVFIGHMAGSSNTGNGLIAIGINAGKQNTGNNNIFIGNDRGNNPLTPRNNYMAIGPTKTLISGYSDLSYVGINTEEPTSTLDINGSISTSIEKAYTVTGSSHTLNKLDYTLIVPRLITPGYTVNLPNATNCKGRIYTIVNKGLNTVYISAANSGNVIDYNDNNVTTLPRGYITVQAYDNDWIIIND